MINDKVTIETYEPYVEGTMRCTVCGDDHKIEEATSNKRYFNEYYGYMCSSCFDDYDDDGHLDNDYDDDYEGDDL